MKKWIHTGMQLVIVYFAVAILIFIFRKTGFIHTDSSAWITAAAAVFGNLIGLCVLQIYKVVKRTIDRSRQK